MRRLILIPSEHTLRAMMRNIRISGVTALLLVLASCASVLQSNVPDMSRNDAPPTQWATGVKFKMSDPARMRGPKHSTRVEFVGSAGTVVVTERDQFTAPGGETGTPWYRLTAGEGPVLLRVTVEHAEGVQTTGEYPLSVRGGYFYVVGAGVYTRAPEMPAAPYPDINPVAFPLNPRVPAAPGDSLWVSHRQFSRECYGRALCH